MAPEQSDSRWGELFESWLTEVNEYEALAATSVAPEIKCAFVLASLPAELATACQMKEELCDNFLALERTTRVYLQN